MILPPRGFFPVRRETQAELDLALLQMQGRKFWNTLAKYQAPKKKKKK